MSAFSLDRLAALARSHLRRPRVDLPLLVLMAAALLVLFEREWRHGEIFSPADLVFEFFPWAHDAPRQPAANPTPS